MRAFAPIFASLLKFFLTFVFSCDRDASHFKTLRSNPPNKSPNVVAVPTDLSTMDAVYNPDLKKEWIGQKPIKIGEYFDEYQVNHRGTKHVSICH